MRTCIEGKRFPRPGRFEAFFPGFGETGQWVQFYIELNSVVPDSFWDICSCIEELPPLMTDEELIQALNSLIF